ncbi:MAG: S9 family peptidase [Methanosarcinaceae archaeon]|nr:S9 family peptidase [Methanosarcinaceae archaeon]
MRRSSAILMIAVFFLSVACDKKTSFTDELPSTTIDNSLTEEEKAAGVMTPEIMWKFGRLGSFSLSPDGASVLYTVTNIDLETEARETNIYKISSSGGEPVRMTNDGGNSPVWFGNRNKIAYSKGGSLITMNTDGSDKQEVTGLSDFEIFSISPAEDKIWFTRRVKLEQTANEKHNLPNAKVRIINDLMYRHWNYWSDYSYSHIFVASFNGEKVSDIKDIMEGQRYESPLAPFFDESEITWSPDGRYIAYTCKRLTGKEYARSTNSDIFLYEIETGREVNISAGNMGYDRCPVFSPDGSRIAYQSMLRDGYESDLDRLFVYDISSGTRNWISKGWDFNVQSINWADNQNIFFSSPHLGTTQIFKVNTAAGEVEKVTEGIHDLNPLSLVSGVLVSGLASMSMAPEIARVDMSTGDVNQITFINKEIYESIKMGRVEERYISTRDYMDLQVWVIYPPDFDPSKKYPALLFCKGGPQGPLGQSWSYRWNYQMMASRGYIVIAPNRRGNSGFGSEWREQISGDYGGANMRDYLDATDAMAKEPFVDAERMGAVGASYGGFSVFYLAGIHGGRYKAFISHCGMFNFTSWYGSTEELWFPDKDIEGPYWNMPRSYNFSPHLMVENWDTPMLIITGANDFRIPYTQSLEAFQAAQLLGIPSRLLFFEDETHFVLKPHNSVIWQREFFEWLDTYLQ